MATPAADPKAAPLAEDLKELALSLPATAFPKNLFCALCNQLAIDSYKLLCCNKAICSPCQTAIAFPTTCPSCDHAPLEADSCTPNKALRNTMRVWLQKQKKKEDAKAAQVTTAALPVEVTAVAPEVQPVGEPAEKPVESVEEAPVAQDFTAPPVAGAASDAEDAGRRAGSASAQPNETIHSPEIKLERSGSSMSQAVTQSIEHATADGPVEEPGVSVPNDGPTANNGIMNGMQGQMGFAFSSQGGFNTGMGWNAMPNMMANGNWNDFNNMNGMSNGMYGNFGGTMGMGMGMNDMSAMNMMNYGGSYGNGWNGMGGGYGNFNGSSQMGGYNQSGAYPDMMNQFPKNNFPNQNQNRFHANQGGQNPQRDRNGSRGSFGPALQNAHSRPGSRSGPAQNVRRFQPSSPSKTSPSMDVSINPETDECVSQQRDGQSPDRHANAASEAETEREQAKASAEDSEQGKVVVHGERVPAGPQVGQQETSGDISKDDTVNANATEDGSNGAAQTGGLNPIQTFDSGDADMQNFDQSMMGNGMHPDMAYQQAMMNQIPPPQMNASFDSSMNMNMGYDQQNSFGPRGGFNNGAYGAARVLVGQATVEPVGVGVAGAPTGPRAMREGRPNTGFSSRTNSNRFPPVAPKSVASTNEPISGGSPHRRVRSRSPLRDEGLRVMQKSPTRSRSQSRSPPREEAVHDYEERSQSADYVSRQDDRGRSPSPKPEDDGVFRKERKNHRSSRHDERDDEYENRHRSERDSRGTRTRDVSLESKYRSSRRDKEKYRSGRSHRDRSKDHRRRHRSQERFEDEDVYANIEKDSDGSSRRKYRSGDKDKYRERSRDRDRERDRKDRKDRDRDYGYDREKDRSREKDKDRRRRRDREPEEDERDLDDDRRRSFRRSRKDRDREPEREPEQYEQELPDRSSRVHEEDIVGQMMKKRAASPPLNAPTGPSANGFSIKGRSKNTVMPPPQPPTGPRAFQPPKGPAADRNKDRGEARDHRRKSSVSSGHATPITPTAPQDHYAAERERHARERDGRERSEKAPRESSSHKSLHSRISSRPSLSSKRSRDDAEESYDSQTPVAPKGPKVEIKAPTAPASHRDKRRKSGTTGDDNIANLFTAGLRKNAKRRGGVRTEGDVEREMMERERERR
ncbi:hypothetical protein T440DRAFT_521815 [Plenodomus tracheiphilus IPT5]|uniref:RING-type domain-containing protein n=1 Tax=Plenodomus tracheiphilus IPT5 TaxID=1408161 RepID=A0A6A7ATR2_9PLEO|nr:hypothetical protein T440DRAFT_521815 [Plenodomus tracheiphilus IPT5]